MVLPEKWGPDSWTVAFRSLFPQTQETRPPATPPFPLIQVSKLPAPFDLRLKSLGRLAAPEELSPFHIVLKSRVEVHMG